MERLGELIKEKKPSKLIAVGDRVSRNIIEKGMPLDVLIIDNKVMRKAISPMEMQTEKTLRMTNPAGTIADEAWPAIRAAIDYEGRAKVLVEGEEDLLTLVAVLAAPENSWVVYGQPREGIVVVSVTEDAKRKIRQIVGRMEDKKSKN